MADQGLKQEIDELRAELDALVKRLDEEPEAESGGESLGETGGGSLRDQLSAKLEPAEVQKHLMKFLESLGRDIKDSKPKALVAAFVAGFAAGRAVGR
jgi:hypothetical protein